MAAAARARVHAAVGARVAAPIGNAADPRARTEHERAKPPEHAIAMASLPEAATEAMRDTLTCLNRLGIREREIRHALERLELAPDATLEAQVRGALKILCTGARRTCSNGA